jgi:hypothetical protein
MPAFYLFLEQLVHLFLYVRYREIYRLHTHGTFFTRSPQTVAYFFSVKSFSATILFYDYR